MIEPSEYLQPDFNPAKCKVADLRNLLMQNDVQYSASAKKQDLIDLFNDEVKPKASQLLKALDSVVATDDRIEVVEKKKKKKKSSKKSKDESSSSSTPTPTPDVEEIPPPSPKKKSPRKVSSSKVSLTKTSTTSNELGTIPDLANLDSLKPPKSPKRKSSRKEEKVDSGDEDIVVLKSPRKISSSKKIEKEAEKQAKEEAEKKAKKEADKEARKLEKEADKEARKLEKEAKKEAEKLAEKQAKKEAKRLQKEAKLKEEEDARLKEEEEAKLKEEEEAKLKLQKETVKEERKRERSPRKVSSSSKITKPKKTSSSKAKNEEIEEILSKKEETITSPFKVDPKMESSFSNDNVFQSPVPSSPEFKTQKVIPRKRGTTESPEKPSKLKVTKPLKKTAFSSSPVAAPSTKSPVKKSLVISKFEDDNSFSEKFNAEALFGIEDEKTEIAEAEDDIFHVSSELEDYQQPQQPQRKDFETFATPFDGNVSRVSIPSSVQGTPSKTPYSKAQSSIRESISSWFQKTPTKETPQKDQSVTEDPELIQSDAEEEDSTQASVNVLESLQRDIDSTYKTVLEETNEALKQVNEIINEEQDEVLEEVLKENQDDDDLEEIEEDEQDVIPSRTFSFSIPWCAIFDFVWKLAFFVIFAVAIVSGLWYREQRVLIGYCGSEIDIPTFPHTESPYLQAADEILQDYKPRCLKCPEHAICLPRMNIKCKQDFIAVEPWYQFSGVLPFSSYCVKDQEKENIISEVVSKSLELLRTRNAAIKCGDGEDLEVGISDEELYNFFYTSKNPSINDHEFNEIWSKVLEDLEKEPEITLRLPESDDSESSNDDLSSDEDQEETDFPHGRGKIVFRSTSTLKLSISCKFKKEIYERFEANKYYFIGALVAFIVSVVIYHKYQRYQERQSKVREISGVIITRLKKQQENAVRDVHGATPTHLSTIQLRDELLVQTRSAERFTLWVSILAELEKNPSIRSSSKEIHGDIVRVLEWIGE